LAAATYFLVAGADLRAEQAGPGAVIIRGDNINSPITTGGLSDAQFQEIKKLLLTGGALSETQQKLIEILEKQLAISREQIRTAFVIIGEADVPDSMIGAKLAQIARKFNDMQAEMARVAERYPKLKEIAERAKELIAAGKFAEASDLIEQQRKSSADLRREAAELTALKAMAASIALRPHDAASLYKAARALADDDAEAKARYAVLQTRDLVHSGDEHARQDYMADAVSALEEAQRSQEVKNSAKLADDIDHLLPIALVAQFTSAPNRDAFRKAREAWERLIQRSKPGSDDWFTAKNGLGALYIGVDDGKSAAPIYQELLDRGVPPGGDTELIVVANASSAFAIVGYDNDDQAMLRKAQDMAQKAVDLSGSQDDRSKHLYRYNLAIKSYKLGEVTKDETVLRTAVRQFEDSLTYITPENAPLSWATTNMNIATTYGTLASWKPNEADYASAIGRCEEALKIYTRDNPRHFWYETALMKADVLVKWSAAFPNVQRISSALVWLKEIRDGLPKDDDDKIRDVEITTGDAFAQLYRQTRSEPARKSAMRAYDRALERNSEQLDLATMSVIEGREKEIKQKKKALTAGGASGPRKKKSRG
jgi:hypothetical protein